MPMPLAINPFRQHPLMSRACAALLHRPSLPLGPSEVLYGSHEGVSKRRFLGLGAKQWRHDHRD